jgi:hypothetical protein
MATIVEPSDGAAVNGSPYDGGDPAKRPVAAHIAPSASADRAEFWSAAAPARLRKGGVDADEAWGVYWKKRQPPATVARLVHAIGSPLAWGVSLAALTEECRAIVDLAADLDRGLDPEKFAKGKRQARLRETFALWLEAARDGDTDVGFGLGCLAAAHVLDRAGAALGAEDGWPVVDFLAATAAEAQPWDAVVGRSAEAALAQQLAAGELPLTLAYLFPEMAPLAALAKPGRQRLAAGLNALPGDRGLVRAGHLPALLGLAACWTRCRAMGRRIDKGAWKSDVQDRFGAVVRQAIRWVDADGRPLLAGADAATWTADFLAAAIRYGGDQADAAAARGLLAGSSIAAEAPPAKCKPPRPSTFSESANLALLRSSWAPDAATVAVDYSGVGMRLEASAAGRRLFCGVWTASSRIDGKLIKPAGAWDAVCWFTDKDVDYLELKLDLEGGARLERQILLARRDNFLYLADHLQHSAAASLEHAWQLPLVDGLAWRGEEETRDALVAAGRDVMRVLPLALPEWRVDPRMGELTLADGALRLDQRTAARSVACPVFLDLDPRRVGKPCTWRQLTVAEALQVQPPDVAVGYRVQCGKKQWLFYRSQAPRGNRTVLGQNTSSEFLAARFLSPSGEVEQLIQVEG